MQQNGYTWIKVIVLLILFNQHCVIGSTKSASTFTEPRVKAAIIFKISRFITWPDDVKKIILCSQGEKSFNTAMIAVAQKVTRGRKIEVRVEAPGSKPGKDCNILFISRSSNTISQTLSLVNGKPVLTISDKINFAELGGVIGLFRKNGKIKFSVNLTSTDRSGLKISSQLLNLAKIVK